MKLIIYSAQFSIKIIYRYLNVMLYNICNSQSWGLKIEKYYSCDLWNGKVI